MIDITKVNHIGLRVKNFETSRNFYEQLGFKHVAGPLGSEPVAIVEHPSGVNINFIVNADQHHEINQLMDVAAKYSGYTHVALEVNSADETLSKLGDLGISLSGEPMQHLNGVSFFIRDPDRNVIEFIEYKKCDN